MCLYIYPVNNWKMVRFLSICKTLVKTFVVQILVVLGNYDMFLQMLQYLDFIRLIWVEVNGKFRGNNIVFMKITEEYITKYIFLS